jgi:hypothetical protein
VLHLGVGCPANSPKSGNSWPICAIYIPPPLCSFPSRYWCSLYSIWGQHLPQVVLATVPNRRVGSASGFEPEPNRCNGSYHTKTRTVAIGLVLPPKTRHYKSKICAPIKYLSSDRIVTWSVGRLSSFSPSFTSRSQICGRSNIHRIAIENPGISPDMWRFITAIQWILVQSQIWQREVKEGLKLHNLRTDHIVIRSELKYSIRVTVAGTANMEPRSGLNPAKNRGFMSGSGNKPSKPQRVGLLGGSWPGPGPSGRFQPGLKPGNPEPLLILATITLLAPANCLTTTFLQRVLPVVVDCFQPITSWRRE